MPRTKRESIVPEEISQTDLELIDSATPIPNAPKTDLELSFDRPSDEPEPEDTAVFPGTDLESGIEIALTESRAEENPEIHQTDVETAFDELPTESSSPGSPSASQTDSENADDGSSSDDGEQHRSRLRMPRRRGQRVVSIDAERSVETDADRLRSDFLDLVESLKGRKILTGTIQGIEQLTDDPTSTCAVIYHGDYKILIPALATVEEPTDYRGQPKGDVLNYLLSKRMGAEVDYIIKSIDQEKGLIGASRMEAMVIKRRDYYLRTDRDGNYQIYEGIRAEARVVSVIRAGIFVDLFGVECYIPLRELSYQRWADAGAHYQPGQRVLVKVLSVDRSDRDRPEIAVSVKQAGENPYEKALRKYSVGNRYVGTVSMVDLTGVFVSLDGGVDCLCSYPKRGRPPRGCRVTVRILGINEETNRIWGVITHMSTAR